MIGDVGQGDWEEIDFAPAPARGRGANLGWGWKDGTRSTATPTSPAADHYPRRSRRPTSTRTSRLLGHRRVRRPGPGAARAEGPLRVRRLLPQPAVVGSPGDPERAGRPAARPRRARVVVLRKTPAAVSTRFPETAPRTGSRPRARRVRPVPPHARRLAAGCPASSGSASRPRERGSAARTAASGGSACSTRPGQGRVVAQSPRPGARRARGTRVHLTVSRGRR